MTAAAQSLEDAPPISVAQEAIYTQSVLAPRARSYNETISIRKDGPLDLDAFRSAFNEIVRRHAAWRTTFEVSGGRPVQVVHAPSSFDLPVLDLSELGDDAERHAVRVVAEVSRVPYDLRRGSLIRPRLIKFSDHHHRLYLSMHHLVFDGVAVYRVVLPELIAIYDAFCAGEPSPLGEPTTTYADYARWEQEWMETPRAQRRLEYWRTHLERAPTLSLPLDRRRPESPRYQGSVASLEIPEPTVTGLRNVGREAGATLFQVLVAAWAVVLSRYSGRDDVALATAADLRQRPEFEPVVGCSLTPLVLRLDLSGDPTFSEVVARARNEVLDGLDHLVPFGRIVPGLDPAPPPGANPVYQTMLVLEPLMIAPDPSWSVHQMEGAIGDAVGGTKLDLELGLDERPDGSIDGRLVYDRDLFERSTVDRLIERCLEVIVTVVADPGVRLSGLVAGSARDRSAWAEWNATATSRRARSVPELVAARAAIQPDAPAVSGAGGTLTYGELIERSERAVRRLATEGVRRGRVVALRGTPSPDLVADALGAMSAGAAYLLVDPARPEGRPAEPSGGPETSEDLAEAMCCVQVEDDRGGAPLVAGCSHRAAVDLASALGADLGLGPGHTTVVLPETLYRASVVELWMPLAAGARVVLAPAEAAADGAALSALVARERASFLHASPGTWRRLLDSGLRATRGLVALSGGDTWLDPEVAARLLERVRAVFCAFGPRGMVGYASWGRVEAETPPTLGFPGANRWAAVVDRTGAPLPVDLVGELVVAGDGGSPMDPGATIPTGVLARWRADGRLEPVRSCPGGG